MGFNVKIIGGDQKAVTSGAGKELVASARPARFYSATVYNSSGGTVYLQLHDAAAAPADGVAPLMVMAVTAQQTQAFDFQDGLPMGTGIYLCLSSTDVTKTLVAANSGIILATLRITS